MLSIMNLSTTVSSEQFHPAATDKATLFSWAVNHLSRRNDSIFPAQFTSSIEGHNSTSDDGLIVAQNMTSGCSEPGSEADGNYTSEDLWRENDKYARAVIPSMVYVALLMAVGVPGNALAIYVFGFRFRMTTQHFLIVCLALCDVIIDLIAMPTEIADLRFHLTFSSDIACRLLRFLTLFSALISNCILIVIAMDRYRRVCHPLRPQMSLRLARIGAAVSVGLSLMVSWPLFVITGLRTTETSLVGLCGKDCSFSDDFKDTGYPAAMMTTLGVGFLIMAVALAVLYFKIWRQARAHRTGLRSNRYPQTQPQNKAPVYSSSQAESSADPGVSVVISNSDPPFDNHTYTAGSNGKLNENSQGRKMSDLSIISLPTDADSSATDDQTDASSRKTQTASKWPKLWKKGKSLSMDKTTLVAFAVTLVFVLSFLPYLTLMSVRRVLRNFEQSLSDSVQLNFYNIFVRSYFLNSAANPVIYGVFNSKFRQECAILFKKMTSLLFCRGCSRESDS